MDESRVSFVCSIEKLKELAPLLMGDVSVLHIEPVTARPYPQAKKEVKPSGSHARDRIEALIEANLDNEGFEMTRQELRLLLAKHGFKNPNASVSHAMPALTEKYELQTVGTGLWRMAARGRALALAAG